MDRLLRAAVASLPGFGALFLGVTEPKTSSKRDFQVVLCQKMRSVSQKRST